MRDRQVWASELVVLKDIVERTGINPTTLANLAGARRDAADFPEPVHGRGSRGIWLWPEVDDWYRTRYPEYMAPRRPEPGSSRQRDPRPVARGRGRRAA